MNNNNKRLKVSLFTDHLAITPNIVGRCCFRSEATIRGICAEMSITIIDMAVNIDYIHLFFHYKTKIFSKFYPYENQWKIEQDAHAKLPTPRRMV